MIILRYVICFVLVALAFRFFKTAMALFQTVHRLTASAAPVSTEATAGGEVAEPTQIDHDGYAFTINERSWSVH